MKVFSLFSYFSSAKSSRETTQILSKLLLSVWITISIYVGIFYWLGAYFACGSMLFGALILSPITCGLLRKKYYEAAKYLFLISCNFYIISASLGLRNSMRAEFYAIPAAMVATLIFDHQHKKRIVFGFLLALFTSGILLMMDPDVLPSTWTIDSPLPLGLVMINFVGAFVLAVVFMSILKGTIYQLKDQAEKDYAHLKIVFDSVQVGVWEWDENQKELYWDQNMYRLYQCSPNDFVSPLEAWNKTTHPDDQARIKSEWDLALAGKKDFDTHLRVKLLNGKSQYFMCKAKMNFDEHGKPLRIIGVTIDATESAVAELEKQQVAEALSAGAIYSIADINGKILEVNEAFCQLTGYTRQELIGSTHRMVNSGFHKPEFFQNLWTTIKSGHIWHGEIQNKAKDGSLFWISEVIVPTRGLDGQITKFIAVKFDITKQKMMQQALMHSSKMSALGEMAGGMGHEINNPLAIIIGKVGLLRMSFTRGNFDQEKFDGELEKIGTTAQRIAKIVQGLRTYSRDSTNDPESSLQIKQVIEETIALCGERAKNQSIELRLKCPMEAFVSGKPEQLSQVFMNLLSNAFDAVEKLPEKWVEIQVMEQNDKIVLRMTDSGAGIPKTTADKIMQPFFTTKEIGKGTGLGLSISKNIIEQHRGELYVDHLAKNTCFVIELPRQKAILGKIS